MRILAWLAVILVTIIGGGAGGGYLYLTRSLPQIDGRIEVTGINGEVDITRDRYGVPHIVGASEEDVYFGLGFAHAQDRLWQMEFQRRVSAGRLSEIIGEETVKTDMFLRTLGARRKADLALQHLDADTLSTLEAYTAGVNEYINNHADVLPPEFLILRTGMAPWTLGDSVAWVKMMALSLGANMKNEAMAAQFLTFLPPEKVTDLFPPYPGDKRLPIQGDLAQYYASLDIDLMMAEAPRDPADIRGSNNWVLSGDRTSTGKPLLSNDPHLGYGTPAVWYFAHLQAPGLNVIGATLPGVPMVILGRNDRISWGFTNTGPDVQDLFIERINPDNPNQYQTPDGWADFTVINEVIRVKNGADIPLTVRETRHGPVMSDADTAIADANKDGYVMALQWTALLEKDESLRAGQMLGKAGNFKEFREALKFYNAPQQNMVYADIDGNIGWVAPGRVPMRHPENKAIGRQPVPGWDPIYDWQGFIPFDELPQALNPANGYIMTANAKVVDNDYPHFITSGWASPERTIRLTDRLEARDHHSVESTKLLLMDHLSLQAQTYLNLIAAADPAGDFPQKLQATLSGWKGEMAKDRIEPLIYSAWYRAYTRRVLADELGDKFDGFWHTRGILMKYILTDKPEWCDDTGTDGIESCQDQAALAMEDAAIWLQQRFGADMTKWQWGDAHMALHAHRPFDKVSALAGIFSRKVPVSGGPFTVNQQRYKIDEPENDFTATHGPSLRGIYDMSDPNNSLYIHTTGQSGHFLSPHYDDMLPIWSAGELIPMSMKRSDYTSGATGQLVLHPPF